MWGPRSYQSVSHEDWQHTGMQNDQGYLQELLVVGPV